MIDGGLSPRLVDIEGEKGIYDEQQNTPYVGRFGDLVVQPGWGFPSVTDCRQLYGKTNILHLTICI
jgi:hypothetical protein